MENHEKIVILRAYRPFLKYLTVYKLDNFRSDEASILGRNIRHAIGLTFLFAVFTFIFLPAQFLFSFKHHFNLRLVIQPLAFLLAGLPASLVYFLMFSKIRKVVDTLDYLHGIVVERSNLSPQLLENYLAIDKFHAFITTAMAKAIFAIVTSLFMLSTIFPISYAISGYPEPNQWALPMAYSTPYVDKWVNVYVQFVIDVAVEVIVLFMYYLCHMISAFFYIGLCLYVRAMRIDLKLRMQEIHENVHRSVDYEFVKNLINEIQFHARIFEVADVISDVISTILFLLLISYSITLAAFLVGLELVESYGIACFGMATAVINLLTQMVVYCAFSENMTNDLFDTADIFYESPWYELPINLQKLYFLPILRLHRVFRLSGLGVIECSLRVFASIVQTAASYFLLMKSLK